MSDRRHRGRDEEPDKARSSARRPDPGAKPDTAAVLDLQERAGNRAVAAMLELHGADGARSTAQRQPTGDTPTAEPANDGTKGSAVGTMTIPDMKMTIPIQSFSRQLQGTGQKKEASGELFVSMAATEMDPRLAQAVARGEHVATITIMAGPQTITLHDVFFSGYSVSGETASLSLNFASMELGSGG